MAQPEPRRVTLDVRELPHAASAGRVLERLETLGADVRDGQVHDRRPEAAHAAEGAGRDHSSNANAGRCRS